MGAGTGGTSATIGRYIRYRPMEHANTKLCVADPEGSIFFDTFCDPHAKPTHCKPSRLEGVGRPRSEPSFIPGLVDRMIKVEDNASIAMTYWLSENLGRKVGGSTGLNLFATLNLAFEMQSQSKEGSLVTLICDSGARYEGTIFDTKWLNDQGLQIDRWLEGLTEPLG